MRSESINSESSKVVGSSFFRAHPVAMLFARFVDSKLIDTIQQELKDILVMSLGSLTYTKYHYEVEFVGVLLYYLSSLVAQGATVGQLFCGLQSLPVTQDAANPSKEYIHRHPSSKAKYFFAAFFYALLPYLYNRRSQIVSAFVSFWQLLLEPEHLPPLIETPQHLEGEEQEQQLLENTSTLTDNENSLQENSWNDDNNHDNHSNDSNTSFTTANNNDTNNNIATDTASTSTIAKNAYKKSIFTMILAAVHRSYLLISHESSIRLERIVNYAYDIHQYFFAESGRYLEFPMRLAQLQLFSPTLPPISTFQIKVSTFSWMLLARIVLLSYYAVSVLLNEIDGQLAAYTAPDTDNNNNNDKKRNNEDDNNSNGDTENNPSNTANHNKVRLDHLGQCPLCLEEIASGPACLPCGHVGCWSCLTTYANKSGTHNSDYHHDGSSSNTLQKQCPICRQTFTLPQIRALYFT